MHCAAVSVMAFKWGELKLFPNGRDQSGIAVQGQKSCFNMLNIIIK